MQVRGVTKFHSELYECRLERASLFLEAPSRQLVQGFLLGLKAEPGRHTDPWAIACSLLAHEVDWPLWHEEHRKARAAQQAGTSFFNPWEYSESGVPNLEPMDFRAAYRALKRLCGLRAEEYFIKAGFSFGEVLDYPRPANAHLGAPFADYNAAKSFAAALPMAQAPFEVLLQYSSREELAHAFAAAGERKPRKNAESAELIRQAGPRSRLGLALRAAPRWNTAYWMRAPEELPWPALSNFKYLLRAMAQDLANYAVGFRVFTKRG